MPGGRMDSELGEESSASPPSGKPPRPRSRPTSASPSPVASPAKGSEEPSNDPRVLLQVRPTAPCAAHRRGQG